MITINGIRNTSPYAIKREAWKTRVCVCVWGGGGGWNDMKGFTKLVTEQRRLGRHIVTEERQFGGQGAQHGNFSEFCAFQHLDREFVAIKMAMFSCCGQGMGRRN